MWCFRYHDCRFCFKVWILNKLWLKFLIKDFSHRLRSINNVVVFDDDHFIFTIYAIKEELWLIYTFGDIFSTVFFSPPSWFGFINFFLLSIFHTLLVFSYFTAFFFELQLAISCFSFESSHRCVYYSFEGSAKCWMFYTNVPFARIVSQFAPSKRSLRLP